MGLSQRDQTKHNTLLRLGMQSVKSHINLEVLELFNTLKFYILMKIPIFYFSKTTTIFLRLDGYKPS